MTPRLLCAAFAVLVLLAGSTFAQTSYRLKGTVKDAKGAPVAGAKIHAEALQGFRGEQFVGQKEFTTTTNDEGEWNIFGLTSGMWVFEATAPNLTPEVVVLPVQYTQRQMQSATGGQLPWDLQFTLRPAANGLLQQASEAAIAGKVDEAASLAGGVAEEKDPETLCSAGHVALLVRQHGLAAALYRQVAAVEPKQPCASLGQASASLMHFDVIGAGRLLWEERDVASAKRRALAAAITDLQLISALK